MLDISSLQLLIVCYLIQFVLGCSNDSENSNIIYGVRWFLGDSFAYDNQDKIGSNYYILSFNAKETFQQNVYVEIASTKTTCTSRVLEIQQDNINASNQSFRQTELRITMYRCNIIQNLWEFIQDSDRKEVEYQIYMIKPSYPMRNHDTTNNIRDIKTQVTLLYTAVYRAVPTSKRTSLKFITLGDWGQIDQSKTETLPNMPYLKDFIDNDIDIKMIVFLGDIAYDFNREKYKPMLKYIEPITSRIAFMVSPGNHEYVYHQETFELFAETFLSPHWDKYHNFYYSMVISDLLFIQYDPQNLLYQSLFDTKIDPLTFMRHELDPQNNLKESNSIPSTYHVIAFSHYPIYCSQHLQQSEECEMNEKRFTAYIDIFDQIGLDLYLSGHLHYYERSHEICFKSQKNSDFEVDHKVYRPYSYSRQFGDMYDQGCPNYVVEGCAGNSLVMTREGEVTAKNITGNISFGTGFGLVKYQAQNPDQLLYEHHKLIEASQSRAVDKFTKILPIISNERDYTWLLILLEIIGVVSLILILESFAKKWEKTQNEINAQKLIH